MDHVEAVRMFTGSASLQDRRPVGLARIRCLFRAHPINIGEICCSDQVSSTGMKNRGMAQGGTYGMNAGNETRIMWHESYRVPVTVLVGLSVTVILISVPQNR